MMLSLRISFWWVNNHLRRRMFLYCWGFNIHKTLRWSFHLSMMIFTQDLMIHSTPNLDVDGACYVPDRKWSFGVRNGRLELVYESSIGAATYASFHRKQKLKKTKWTEVGSINDLEAM
jgi:hypothetical protein